MAKAKKAATEKKSKVTAKAIKPIKKEPAKKKAPAAKGKKEALAAAVPVLSRTPSRASKKEAVAPVKAPALARSASKSSKTLELCLLLDCTGSMSAWI